MDGGNKHDWYWSFGHIKFVQDVLPPHPINWGLYLPLLQGGGEGGYWKWRRNQILPIGVWWYPRCSRINLENRGRGWWWEGWDRRVSKNYRFINNNYDPNSSPGHNNGPGGGFDTVHTAAYLYDGNWLTRKQRYLKNAPSILTDHLIRLELLLMNLIPKIDPKPGLDLSREFISYLLATIVNLCKVNISSWPHTILFPILIIVRGNFFWPETQI